jgi:hypothetical protein
MRITMFLGDVDCFLEFKIYYFMFIIQMILLVKKETKICVEIDVIKLYRTLLR